MRNILFKIKNPSKNYQMIEKQIVKGLKDRDYIEIISGLKEGDLVRTD